MDGDAAKLQEICQLTEQYNALLMVDEAHAFGVKGATGMGLAEELGLSDQIHFHMGTLGKAAGVAGGYLAASQNWIDLISKPSSSSADLKEKSYAPSSGRIFAYSKNALGFHLYQNLQSSHGWSAKTTPH